MGATVRGSDRSIWLATTALMPLMALIPSLGLAQVILDGSVGPEGKLDGPDFEITDDLGTRAGDNLFHSFEEFNLSRSQRATFSGSDEIDNVISRVTGENESNINGTLRSTMPEADFYFINPNGVTFGPNATLDVQGSFHVSTADELRFGDGDVFSATNPNASGLSVAEPRAFGFFDADPGAILVDGSTLKVDEGETLSLVGGDITIDGGNDGAALGGNQGKVSAEGGTINLVSAKTGSGQVIQADGQFLPGGSSGDIVLINGALVTTTGNNGGVINIAANNLRLTESLIAGDIQGDGTGGELNISAKNLAIYGGIVSKSTFGDGDAGDINILTENMRLEGSQPGIGARILSSSFPDPNSETLSSGNAGYIVVNSETIVLLNGGRISTTTSSGGDAGDIQINANKLLANRAVDFGVTGVFSDASVDISRETRATGNAGSINVSVGEIELVQGGQIRSLSFSEGDAGNISILTDRFHIDGGSSSNQTEITADAAYDSQFGLISDGNGGNITIDAKRIEIFDGGIIESDTHGIGDAGSLDIAADKITIRRENSSKPTGISIDSAISDDGLLVATGDAGRIIVTVGDLVIEDGGEIRSVTFGSGRAGDIEIEASSIRVDGQESTSLTLISSRAATVSGSNTLPSGDVGSVSVSAGSVELFNGASIDSKKFGSGDAGSVELMLSEGLKIDGISRETGNASGVSSEAIRIAAGDAGSISISAPKIEIANGGEITSRAAGPGDGGSVVLQGEQLAMSDSATVEASAQNGEAGVVDLQFDQIYASNKSIIESSAAGENAAGGVFARAETIELADSTVMTRGAAAQGGQIELLGKRYVVLTNSSVNSNGALPRTDTSLIEVEGRVVAFNGSTIVALTGDGEPITGSGVIDVDGTSTLISPDSTVDASSSVAISGLLTDFSSQLLVLDSQFADVSRLLRESCESGGGLGGSTFVESGQSPAIAHGDGLLPGFYSGAFVTDIDKTEGGGPVALEIPCS